MSDVFTAHDPFQTTVHAGPLVTIAGLTPAPAAPTAGKAFWFDGDDAPFHLLVSDLQESGELPTTQLHLPLPYLSVSQVEQYLRCPQQYYRRYILGQRRPPGVAMVQGTGVHAALETGYRHVITEKTVPKLDMVLSSYSDSMDKGLAEEVVWSDDEDAGEAAKDPGALKDQGVGLLTKWHTDKLPNVHPQSAEKSFITSFGDVPIVGRIDLIDRIDLPADPAGESSLVEMHPMLDAVVDSKVVGKTYPKGRVDASLQLSLYAHATGLPRQRYDFYCKTKVPKLAEVSTTRDAQQIRWAVSVFNQVANAISAGSFPPTAPDSWICSPKWCGYHAQCRGGV